MTDSHCCYVVWKLAVVLAADLALHHRSRRSAADGSSWEWMKRMKRYDEGCLCVLTSETRKMKRSSANPRVLRVEQCVVVVAGSTFG